MPTSPADAEQVEQQAEQDPREAFKLPRVGGCGKCPPAGLSQQGTR